MITDEELTKLIQKRQIERFKSGDESPKVLEFVLDYLEQSNDVKLLKYIFTKVQISKFNQISNGIKRLQQIVIEIGAEYIYDLAYIIRAKSFMPDNIENEIIKDLEEAIIKTGNAEYIYNFARTIKGANIQLLAEAIIKIGNAEYIYNFAWQIKGANIQLLEEAIIKAGDAEYMFNFARTIKGANIQLLEDAVIKTENAEYIYNFARHIKEANIQLLEEAIIKTKNAKYIYMFAKFLDGVDIALLEKAIKETEDSEYIQLFEHDLELQHLKEKQIVDKAQATENIIFFATKIMEERQDREKILDDLIDNIENEENKLKLKVYGEFLTDYNKSLLEALELDREYTAGKQKKK